MKFAPFIGLLLVASSAVQARAVHKREVGEKAADVAQSITNLSEEFMALSKSAQKVMKGDLTASGTAFSQAAQLPATLAKILADCQAVQGIFSPAEAEAIFVPVRTLLPAIKKTFTGFAPKPASGFGFGIPAMPAGGSPAGQILSAIQDAFPPITSCLQAHSLPADQMTGKGYIKQANDIISDASAAMNMQI
ncbi:hypothetical protein INT43_001896 [Umbelopsis isabellina]|uniref:Uncharacterized protein n=1 Tax=Mortierella isabellina TaxID=91625 RepID=A0A8H7UEV4_MORIS|nr:hypothetical protein INT43_001896 [Umbelopsis isabellina]